MRLCGDPRPEVGGDVGCDVVVDCAGEGRGRGVVSYGYGGGVGEGADEGGEGGACSEDGISVRYLPFFPFGCFLGVFYNREERND